MKLAEIFINQTGRLRSGWRATIFFLAWSFLFGIIGTDLSYLSKEILLSFITQNINLLVVSVFVGWLCGRFLEGLPFRALGIWFTKNWLKDFGLGLLFGAISVCFAALITIIFGATSFQFNREAGQSAIWLTLAVSLGIFTLGAAAEEAFFRGYILQTFTRAKLVLFGVALTALLFGLTHTDNPSANFLSFFNTILAGVWFGAAYLKTRTLWFPIGLHLAWNWVLGAVLGISVSGINIITPAPILLPTNTGSTVLTGGDYGIEGGIACTISLIIFILLIWFLPILKPTEEMLILTNEENPGNEK